MVPTFHLTPDALTGVKSQIDARDCLLLGLTGGVATGKSTVSAMLSQLGAKHVDFDLLARQVVMPGTPAHRHIVDYFGPSVLLPDGAIDRKYLSHVVFNHPKKRKKLESLTHPGIIDAFFRAVSEISASDPTSIIQISVPLLIERQLQPLFHKVVLVYASKAHQLARLVRRDGIDTRQAERIIASQTPIHDKRDAADIIIENEGALEATRRQVDALWRRLVACQDKRTTTRRSPVRPPT
jgi:dephospho-CoA kinase